MQLRSYGKKVLNLHYTFTGSVTSGLLQYPTEGCSVYLGSYNQKGRKTKISKDTNIGDEDTRNGLVNLDHIHTNVLHPYCYQLIKWLFISFHEMELGDNKWSKFNSLLSVYVEAFVQGFQNILIGKIDEQVLISWNYNLAFKEYARPVKRELKNGLELSIASYFMRLSQWTNPLTNPERIHVVQAYLAGFYVAKCFLEAGIDLRKILFDMRDAMSAVYMMPDNGYQTKPESEGLRTYQINHCLPANLLLADFELLDKSLVKQALINAFEESIPLYNLLDKCFAEGNELVLKGECVLVD